MSGCTGATSPASVRPLTDLEVASPKTTAPSSRAPDSIAAITHGSQEGIGPAADPSDGGDRDLYPATAHQHVLPRRAALVSVGAGLAGSVAGWTVRSELSPNPYDGGDVGEVYHRVVLLGIKSLISNLLDWGRAPERYKAVDGADPAASSCCPADNERGGGSNSDDLFVTTGTER